MDKPDIAALAERIEQAEGPSRELDAEIAPLQGLRIVDEGHPIGRVCYDQNNHGVPLPAYTASIDAALTLVPEGYALGFKRAPCQRSHAMLATIGYEANASGATPALALVAAALRSQAQGEG